MKILIKILLVNLIFLNIANAEIEKISYSCGDKLCFSWWPKLPNISGWIHNREISLHYSMNTILPIGYNFSNAESIIYARAIWKEKVKFNSLDEFIEDNIKHIKINKPNVIISDEKLNNDFSKKYYKGQKYFDKTSYEKVVYTEEKDEKGNVYFILFTLSSFNEKAYNSSLEFFEKILLEYKK